MLLRLGLLRPHFKGTSWVNGRSAVSSSTTTASTDNYPPPPSSTSTSTTTTNPILMTMSQSWTARNHLLKNVQNQEVSEYLNRMKFYAQNGQPAQVVKEFVKMRQKHIEPNIEIYNFLLEACQQTKDASLATLIYGLIEPTLHQILRKRTNEQESGGEILKETKNLNANQNRNENELLKSARESHLRLILTLSESGKPDAALNHLKKIKQMDLGEWMDDVLYYNPILEGFAKSEQQHHRSKAWQVFDTMIVKDNIKPDTNSFIAVLKAQKHTGSRACLQMISTQIEEAKINKSRDLLAQLAIGYSNAGDFNASYDIIQDLLFKKSYAITPYQPDQMALSVSVIKAVSALMENCQTRDQFYLSRELGRAMLESRRSIPNLGIEHYTSFIKYCKTLLKKAAILQIDDIFSYPSSSKQDNAERFWNEITNEVFSHKNIRPDEQFYSSLLSLLIQSALNSNGSRPTNLLENPGRRNESLKILKEAEELLSRIRYEGFSPNLSFYNSLVRGYALLVHPELKFEERLNRALKVVESMKALNLVPNVVTYTELFNACLPLHRPSSEIDKRIIKVEEEMRANKIMHDSMSLTTFLRVLGIGREYEPMFQAFERAKRDGTLRNVNVYNTLLHACKEDAPSASRALKVFFQEFHLESPPITPNALTFHSLLGCCTISKRLKLGEHIFHKVRKESGVAVDTEMLNGMINLYANCDEETAVLDVINHHFNRYSITPNHKTLHSLLYYYCISKNDMGKAAMALELVEKKFRLHKDPKSVELLIRGHLLRGDLGAAVALLTTEGSLSGMGSFKRILEYCAPLNTQEAQEKAGFVLPLAKQAALKQPWQKHPWLAKIEAKHQLN